MTLKCSNYSEIMQNKPCVSSDFIYLDYVEMIDFTKIDDQRTIFLKRLK